MSSKVGRSEQIKMQSDFRFLLQQELVSRVKRNSAYSLRAFAKSLRTDYSTLAKLINGKRPIGKRVIQKLGDRLGLDPAELNNYTNIPNDPTSRISQKKHYLQLAMDSFEVIAEWYHFAILELIRIEGFKPDQRWIAKKLGISHQEVNLAVERLTRVGLLHISKDQKTWTESAGERLTVITPQESSRAQRILQRQILEKAIDALEYVPVDRRDQTAMTMAIDMRRLPEAKERIKKFRRSIAKYLSRSSSRHEVYNLSISLYPISDFNVKGNSL